MNGSVLSTAVNRLKFTEVTGAVIEATKINRRSVQLLTGLIGSRHASQRVECHSNGLYGHHEYVGMMVP